MIIEEEPVPIEDVMRYVLSNAHIVYMCITFLNAFSFPHKPETDVLITNRRSHQVPVNEAHFVYAFKSESEFGSVEASQIFTENFLLYQQTHHVATRDKIHHEIKIFLVL